MNLEVLVEEPSAERALEVLLPRILEPSVNFSIRVFQGKTDLLNKLPQRLAGYATWVHHADTRVAVLVDRDDDDCSALKQRLEEMGRTAGLVSRSAMMDGPQVLLVSIAVEELEAWFLGDVPALCTAYPRVPRSLGDRARFRDPDTVSGTWEALEQVLQRSGYQAAGLRKVETAGAVAQHMNVDKNRSRSFAAFRDGIRRLAVTA